jgi:Ca-activated chloride channel family protein
MKLALDSLNPSDTFNLITFAGDTHILFPEPVPATPANLTKAQAFLSSRKGDGGTEMLKAVDAALKPSDDQSHVRIVCFMTDGYVGNEMEIIAAVQNHPNARVCIRHRQFRESFPARQNRGGWTWRGRVRWFE